jgi:hypothetical protein
MLSSAALCEDKLWEKAVLDKTTQPTYKIFIASK